MSLTCMLHPIVLRICAKKSKLRNMLLQKTKKKQSIAYWSLIILGSMLMVLAGIIRISKAQYSLTDLFKPDNHLYHMVCLLVTIPLFHKVVQWLRNCRYTVVENCVMAFMASAFSLITMLGKYYHYDIKSSMDTVLQPLQSKICFALAFAGTMLMLFYAFRLVWSLYGISDKLSATGKGRLASFFADHLYRNCMLLISVCWLPFYIIRFPGAMPYDTWQSLAMYFGTTPMTTQHPLVFVVIVGKLTELGTSLGANWLMPLVMTLVQHLLTVLMISYTLDTFRKMGFSPKVMAWVLAFFVILPPMHVYASTVYNDMIYSLAIMLLTLELVYYLYDRKIFFKKPHHGILTALAVFLTIFRYNGLYTMLAVLAVIGLRELWLLIKGRARVIHASVMLVLIIVPLLSGQLLQRSLNAAYDAQSLTSRAILAMPIQQTARCFKEHRNEIPAEILEDIQPFMEWEPKKYAKKYNPRNFDSIKSSINTDATAEEIKAFLGGWFQLVKRYPRTCLEASLHQNYYLFSPFAVNTRQYVSFSGHADLVEKRYGMDPQGLLEGVPVFEYMTEKYAQFQEKVFPKIPVLGLLVNLATYTVLLFGICLRTLLRKDRRPLFLTIALLVTWGITFVGPALYRHPRYIFPIMFSMPALLAGYMLSGYDNTDSDIREETV